MTERPSEPAVVRPTRAEVEQLIAFTRSKHFGGTGEREPFSEDVATANALIARGWLAVSDSQETPAEGREE